MGFLNPDIWRSARPGLKKVRHELVLLAAILLFFLPQVGDAETSFSESSLKAAFIFNFSKFVEWPESSTSGRGEFCIGTLGRTPLDRDLAALAGRVVQGRTIVFRRFQAAEEATKCQVIFISRSEQARVEEILDTFKDLPVLTIADSENFCKKGGMLSLEKESGKIVFDVNFGETQRAKLKPNSNMLKLARKIYGRP